MDSIKYFFSYSRNDAEFVRKLATDLKEGGVNVWLDQLDILPGSRWDASVEQALNEAEGMLVVLSNTSVKSENVLDEVSYAISKSKRVIPLLLHDCEIPFRIARFQRIDFTGNYNTGLQLLIRTINLSSEIKKKAPLFESDIKQKTPELIQKEKEDDPVKLKKKNKLRKPLAYVLSAALLLVVLWLIVKPTLKEKDKPLQGNEVSDTAKNSLTKDTSSQLPDNTNKRANIQSASADSVPKEKLAGNSSVNPVNNPSVKDTQLSANSANATQTQSTINELGSSSNIINKNLIVNVNNYKIIYKVRNDAIYFYITSNDYPSIQVDVNENTIVDKDLDRNYGTPQGKICAQYMLTNGQSMACGNSPSKAALSINNNVYTFIIPLEEVRNNVSSSTVSVQFTFYNKNNRYTFYPERKGYADFSKTYKIDILAANNNSN